MSNEQVLISTIQAIFDATDKDYIVAETIKTALEDQGIEYPMWLTLVQLGWKWQTMVVSAHGFKAEYQAKYDAKAEKNIPLIYFGEGGFENYDVKGGVAYVLIRK